MIAAYWYALSSALLFSLASVFFSAYARSLSPLWINAFKATIALICFSIAVCVTGDIFSLPPLKAILAFFVSGFLGLNVGDLFLMRAFARFGAARTLVVFNFQPVFLGIFAFILFGQTLSANRLVAMGLMMMCMLVLSYERFAQEKKWEWIGPVYAIIGVTLDAMGVLLTRYGFDQAEGLSVLEGNFYRCLGAASGFLVINFVRPLNLWRTLKKMRRETRRLVLAVSTLGTFVSLWLYLSAVKSGDLAVIAAIVCTGPLFSTIFEAWRDRVWPSRYLMAALVFFALGFTVLSA